MQGALQHGKILALIFSSLTTLAFAILGMYAAWNCPFLFETSIKSYLSLAIGIFGFAAGVFVFWRLAKILSIKEGL
ncbi:MAG: hypothetical protein QXZ25_03435 [Candidatus Bathyarchaeia archaeon]